MLSSLNVFERTSEVAMVKGLAYVMYPVKDVARARHFYEQELGLTPARTFQEAWVEYDLPDGSTFAITTMAEGCEPSSNSGGIAFEVENVDRLTDELRKKGRRIKVDPFSSPVCRMSIVLDPEGNAVSLHQATNA
jgi:predicted enzyme related to lactoylglutathione lyase